MMKIREQIASRDIFPGKAIFLTNNTDSGKAAADMIRNGNGENLLHEWCLKQDPWEDSLPEDDGRILIGQQEFINRLQFNDLTEELLPDFIVVSDYELVSQSFDFEYAVEKGICCITYNQLPEILQGEYSEVDCCTEEQVS